jgi:hypothetical protein
MIKYRVPRRVAFVGIVCVVATLLAVPTQHAHAAVPGWSGYMKVIVSEYGSSPSDEEVIYRFDGTATTATDYLWEQDVTWTATYSRIDLPYVTCPDGPTPVSSASGTGSGSGHGVVRFDRCLRR